MSQLEGRDPAGQAVDVALGSRSYREATVRSHGVRREEAGVFDWGGGGAPGAPVAWGLGDPCPGSLTRDLPTTPRCQSP